MNMIFSFSIARLGKLILASLILFSPAALAASAVSIPSGTMLTQETPTNAVLGYEFVVANDTTVNSLGIFDQGSDGLSSAHSVAIWDEVGSLLVLQLFPTGFSILDDGFQFIDITALELTAGLKYTIGVLYTGSNSDLVTIANFASDYVTDPNVSITGGRRFDGGFGYPATTVSEVFLGPNFRFTAVPLPAAFWLLGSALLGLLANRRK